MKRTASIYQQKIEWLGKAMKRKLTRNKCKVHWSDESNERLLELLKDEVDELEYAIKTSKTPNTVLNEAADVANIAMMLADNHLTQNHV